MPNSLHASGHVVEADVGADGAGASPSPRARPGEPEGGTKDTPRFPQKEGPCPVDYRSILDNAPLPILVLQDSRVVYCNHSGYEVIRYFGYAVEETRLEQFDVLALVPAAERDDIRESMRRLLSGRGPLHNIPRTLLDAEGNPVETLASAALVRWKGRPAFELSFLILGMYPILRGSPSRAVGGALPPTRDSLRDARRHAIEPLTPQESRVALSIADGQTTTAIARELDIQLSTLRGYIKSIYRKLEVHSRTELVRLLLGHR